MGEAKIETRKIDFLEVLFVGLGILDAAAFATVILGVVTITLVVTASAMLGLVGIIGSLLGKMFQGSWILGIGIFGYILFGIILLILGGIVLMKVLKMYPATLRAVKRFFAGTKDEKLLEKKGELKSKENRKEKPIKERWKASRACLVLCVVGLVCMLIAAIGGEMGALWESLSDVSVDGVMIFLRSEVAE